MNPFLLPKRIPAKETANVCNVNGTPPGKGIEICASIAVIVANIPQYTIS